MTIRLTSTNTAVISWPSPATGFGLEQTAGLANPQWTTPLEIISDNGTNKFIIVSPPAGNRYYRLHHP